MEELLGELAGAFATNKKINAITIEWLPDAETQSREIEGRLENIHASTDESTKILQNLIRSPLVLMRACGSHSMAFRFVSQHKIEAIRRARRPKVETNFSDSLSDVWRVLDGMFKALFNPVLGNSDFAQQPSRYFMVLLWGMKADMLDQDSFQPMRLRTNTIRTIDSAKVALLSIETTVDYVENVREDFAVRYEHLVDQLHRAFDWTAIPFYYTSPTVPMVSLYVVHG